ncbi:metallo-beta-lactamase family protein [Bacillus sp. FJAT-27916]|uniref:MBL fold metallo-hydrolase n=1 Tax=Bacillaceae TaxID=186817 RepID=UPI0006714AFD|nr:MBL fold metallo-hydrolase [Bacillus sp. FJAT-27916]KMY43236.1 metallo-beta-lactamase family protein [Bacillus sp. FJAT-27916]
MERKSKQTFQHTYIPLTSMTSGMGIEVKEDIYVLNTQIVNVILVGQPNQEDFVLVDAGMPKADDEIIEAVEKRFGEGSKPKAIILTHGHFDHVGALEALLEKWDIPVYAHKLELPYLTGQRNYPEPNTKAAGGLVPDIARFFPNHGIDIGNKVQPLPDDGTVPYMPGWQWLHTPGHTPGHVSLFREEDCFLIAGDAFVGVKQESLYKVLTQKQEISGPPAYFTTDWEAARESVRRLNDLKPKYAVTGHGLPLLEEYLSHKLDELAVHFDEIAKPQKRIYEET